VSVFNNMLIPVSRFRRMQQICLSIHSLFDLQVSTHNSSSACLEVTLRIIQIATGRTIGEILTTSKCSSKYNHLKSDIKKMFVFQSKKCDATPSSIGKNGLPTRNRLVSIRITKRKEAALFLFYPLRSSYNTIWRMVVWSSATNLALLTVQQELISSQVAYIQASNMIGNVPRPE